VFVNKSETDGYIATCDGAVAARPDPVILVPIISTAVNPRISFVSSSAYITGLVAIPSKPIQSARLTRSEYGVVILKIPPQAFDSNQIPSLEPDLPSIGEKVFVYGVEDGGVFPSFSTIEGRVVRIGNATNGPATVAYSTLPYKASFCGAPILSEAKHVVGIMSGPSGSGKSQIVIAKHITEELKANHIVQ
jgi:hypothetical protein